MMTLSGWFKGEVDSRGVWCPSVIGPTPTYPSIYGWRGSCIEGSTTSIALRVGCSRPVQVHGQSSERYDAMFWTLVTLARGTNSRLVPGAIKPEDFSLWHSPRRGTILETTQRGVDSKVMELVNRWHSKEGAKGSVPNLPIQQVYTKVRSTLPTMLKYYCTL